MSERKQYDDGLVRVGLLLANKRKSLGEPYQTREAFIDLRSVELFDGEPSCQYRIGEKLDQYRKVICPCHRFGRRSGRSF